MKYFQKILNKVIAIFNSFFEQDENIKRNQKKHELFGSWTKLYSGVLASFVTFCYVQPVDALQKIPYVGKYLTNTKFENFTESQAASFVFLIILWITYYLTYRKFIASLPDRILIHQPSGKLAWNLFAWPLVFIFQLSMAMVSVLPKSPSYWFWPLLLAFGMFILGSVCLNRALEEYSISNSEINVDVLKSLVAGWVIANTAYVLNLCAIIIYLNFHGEPTIDQIWVLVALESILILGIWLQAFRDSLRGQGDAVNKLRLQLGAVT